MRLQPATGAAPPLHAQVIVTEISEGHALVDRAVAAALRHSKPVYLSICTNIAGLTHPTFDGQPVPFAISPKVCRVCTACWPPGLLAAGVPCGAVCTMPGMPPAHLPGASWAAWQHALHDSSTFGHCLPSGDALRLWRAMMRPAILA